MEKTLLFLSFSQKNTISFVKNSLYPPYLVSTLFLKYLLRSFFLLVGDFPTNSMFFLIFSLSGEYSLNVLHFPDYFLFFRRRFPKNRQKSYLFCKILAQKNQGSNCCLSAVTLLIDILIPYTLNRNKITSPSFTIYSFPSILTRPFSLAPA